MQQSGGRGDLAFSATPACLQKSAPNERSLRSGENFSHELESQPPSNLAPLADPAFSVDPTYPLFAPSIYEKTQLHFMIFIHIGSARYFAQLCTMNDVN